MQDYDYLHVMKVLLENEADVTEHGLVSMNDQLTYGAPTVAQQDPMDKTASLAGESDGM